MPPAKAFNLVWSTISFFSKIANLTLYQTTKSLTDPDSMHLHDDKINVNEKFNFGLGRV